MLAINEWRFCLRQPQLRLSLLLLPLFAFMLAGSAVESTVEGTTEGVPLLKQMHLMLITIMMLALPIVIGAISPAVFLRDAHANMQELILTTPVSHTRRWLLRYGVLVTAFMLLFTLAYGAVVASFAIDFGFQARFVSQSLVNLLLLTGPGVLFLTAFTLYLALGKQTTLTIYACMAAFGIGYLVLSSMTGSPVLAGSSLVSESFYQAMLWLDPLGISPLIDALGKSGESESVSWGLVLNRLLFLVLSGLLVYSALKKNKEAHVDVDHSTSKAKAISSRQSHFAKVWQFITPKSALFQSVNTQLIKAPLLTMLHSRLTQVILLIWPMLIFNEVLSGITHVDAQLVIAPNSIDALNLVAFDLVEVLGAFVIALWSWFICWRDKSLGFDELMAVTPSRNSQILLAQIAALGLMITILLLLTTLGASLAEWQAGSEWRIEHYFVQLGLSGLPLLLLGVIFIGLHHLCRSPLVSGSLIALIILIKFTPMMTALGMTHTLWNIAASPLQAPDNFWGFSASGVVYLPYMLLWLLVSASLILVAIYRSHRGTGLSQGSVQTLPAPPLIFLLLPLAAGLSLHFALVKEKPLTFSHQRDAWQAQYELRYGDWRHQASPLITHIDANVDMYPEQEFADFALSYKLENQTSSPIERVLVGRHGNYVFGEINIEGASQVEFDSELNQAIYRFDTPLLPGEQRELKAKFRYNQPQLWPHRSQQVVKSAFSYLNAKPLLPVVGYQPEWQLLEPKIRNSYGLQKAPKSPDVFSFLNTASQSISLNTVLSTQQGHFGLSQGELRDSWTQEGRVFFRFETQQEISAHPAWLSVPYSALTREVDGVTLSVFSPRLFSPSRNQAVEVNLNAMADTVTWFTRNIAPYPGSRLSLVAMPDSKSASQVLPQLILMGDSIGFRAQPSSKAEFDPRYRRAVQETAKQWFGQYLSSHEPNRFIEHGLSKYLELVLIEQRFGTQAMQALIALAELAEKRQALSQREQFSPTVSLLNATDERDVGIKATLAFARLRQTVGDKTIQTALKNFWIKAVNGDTNATAIDFIQALKQEAGSQHQALIEQVFLEN